MKTIYVLTNPEAGWDCVRGASFDEKKLLREKFSDEKDDLSLDKLRELAEEKGYIIHETHFIES